MASNPQDLRFKLGLVKETPAYHRGESIVIEISYSTSTKDKYQRSSNSALQGIVIHIVPFDGVLDLNVLRFEHGWAGSIIGGMGLLSSQPTIQQIDLCSLYRFERPGHYSVAITSNEVSRLKSAEEGADLRISRSNPMGSSSTFCHLIPLGPPLNSTAFSWNSTVQSLAL